jgi:hypothetical protein
MSVPAKAASPATTPVNEQAILFAKVLKVKEAMGKVSKESNNPFFKSKYADLDAHLDLIEPLLHANGLVLTQSTHAAAGGNIVQSRITDTTTAAFMDSTLGVGEHKDMQKLGGAITYARRYTLSALLAIGAEDDDGNTASGKTSKPAKAAKSAKAATNDF